MNKTNTALLRIKLYTTFDTFMNTSGYCRVTGADLDLRRWWCTKLSAYFVRSVSGM